MGQFSPDDATRDLRQGNLSGSVAHPSLRSRPMSSPLNSLQRSRTQPVDEVLSWSSTYKMSWPKLRRPTICSMAIAEQRLRQRAGTVLLADRLDGSPIQVM